MQQLISFQRIKIFGTAVFPVRMFLPIEIRIDQAARYKITFLQTHFEPLLHILLIDGQFFRRHGGFGDHFLHYWQQFTHMFIQAMQGDGGCFIITGPVHIGPVIFKMFIELEGRLLCCAVAQQEIRGGGHQVLFFLVITRKEHPLKLDHFFSACIHGIHRHAVAQGVGLVRFQLQVEIHGIYDRRRLLSIDSHNFLFFFCHPSIRPASH